MVCDWLIYLLLQHTMYHGAIAGQRTSERHLVKSSNRNGPLAILAVWTFHLINLTMFRLPSLLHGWHPGGWAWPGRGGGAGVQHGLGPGPGAWLDPHLTPGQVNTALNLSPNQWRPLLFAISVIDRFCLFPTIWCKLCPFLDFFACIISSQKHPALY